MIVKNKIKEYGIYIGRFQPFHIGHEHTIERIKKDGRIPVVIIGSADKYSTTDNPYTAAEREKMIEKVYPGITTIPVDDCNTHSKWADRVINVLNIRGITEHNSFYYAHNKEEDRHSFIDTAGVYQDEFYTKCFENRGRTIINVPISNIKVRATDIRKDLERHKNFLNKNVYDYIKDLNTAKILVRPSFSIGDSLYRVTADMRVTGPMVIKEIGITIRENNVTYSYKLGDSNGINTLSQEAINNCVQTKEEVLQKLTKMLR